MVVSERLQHPRPSLLSGFAIAWLSSIAAAFIAGCLYSFFLEQGYILEYSKSVALGERSAWTVLLVVGGVAAAFASVISALTLVFIWWPLSRLMLRREVTSPAAYVSLGMLVATCLAVTILIIQHFFHPMVPKDYWFEFVAILFSGFVTSLTFWSVVRPDRCALDSVNT